MLQKSKFISQSIKIPLSNSKFDSSNFKNILFKTKINNITNKINKEALLKKNNLFSTSNNKVNFLGNQNEKYFISNLNKNNFYKISKKNLLDKDYSHLHIESTDKIYPKIKRYEYDYDLSKSDSILEEFNYFYELEDWDEALNKGFLLLNVFETNPNAKVQTINLCLFLAEIFIKQAKYDNALKLLSKADKKLDINLLKNIEEEGLFYKYKVKLNLLKGLIALKSQKDKEGIILLKESLEIITYQKLLEPENINISIASDHLTILFLQADIFLKNGIIDKYCEKIKESLNFFLNLSSDDFNLEAKRTFIKNVLEFNEFFKNNKNTINDNYIKLATEGLNAIENIIPEIKNSKTRDEYHLRFNLIWMSLQAQNKTIDDKSLLHKIDKFIHILDKLDLNLNLIDSSKLEIFNLKNILCLRNLQNNQNNYFDEQMHKNLLINQFEILKIMKNNNQITNNESIADDSLLTADLIKFYQNYLHIKSYNINQRIEKIIDVNPKFNWDKIYTKAFVENLNFNFFYLQNQKIIEGLNVLYKQSLADNINDEKKYTDEFDKFEQEKNSQKIEELKKLNDIQFDEIKNTSNFILQEKKFNLYINNKSNLDSLNRISKFMQKEISLIIKNNKNNQVNKLDDLILKCLSFDNINKKNLKKIQKLNKLVEKYFIINNNYNGKGSPKINRNMNISNIEIELFNLTDITKGEFNTNLIINSKDNLLNNYREYSTEEIRKILLAFLTVSNTYSKIAEDNFLKLFLFFNEKTFDKNNYFKNMFTIRHNLAHKKINLYLNYSLQILQIVFSSKNPSLILFFETQEAKDNELICELRELIVNNFITKCNTALYFSNTDFNKLKDLVKENKVFLDIFMPNMKQSRIYIENKFDRLEDSLEKNINS